VNRVSRRLHARPLGAVLDGYDLEPYAVCTQQEVAARLGLTRARIQQIEQSALRKLRRFILARRSVVLFELMRRAS
jgi:hypothetical protein